jgi:predicted flap endonuclease-1-like 5' DNA nuclease
MTRQRITTSRIAPPEASLDDLKRIHGIGLNIEKRLHSAGICTFVGLAALSAETIAALIPTLSAKQITKQGWIPQARKLVTNDSKTSTRAKKSVLSTSRQHYHNFTV